MKNQDRQNRERNEVRAAFFGIAGAILVYLLFVCAVRGCGFSLVWVAAGVFAVMGAVGTVAERFFTEDERSTADKPCAIRARAR